MRVLIAILALFALINTCWAFKVSTEYIYDYTGRIATGIPGIRAQVSATGIKAKLILQMRTESQAIVKIAEIQVGTFNDDVDGSKDLRQEVPIEYHPMDPKIASDMERPFGVNFDAESGHVLTVSRSDVEYMTNFRKSVVEILRVIPVLRKVNETGKWPFISVFGSEEETIFGRCEIQYTLTQIPTDLVANDMFDHSREDTQMREANTGVKIFPPFVGERKWRLVKTVSFDKCHEQVILMHSGSSNHSKSGKGQFESLQGRSSVSTFYLQGNQDRLRLKKASIEGTIALNPFGHKLQKLQAITNQTLILVSWNDIITPLSLTRLTKKVKTWHYEVASPFNAPTDHAKPWVNYLNKTDRYEPVPAFGHILGFIEKNGDNAIYKSKILSLLRIIVDSIEEIPRLPDVSTPSSSKLTGNIAVSHMLMASKLIRYLKVDEIDALFQEVFAEADTKGQRRQMLLVDIMAASGAAPPMKVLLEKFKSGNITNARISSIFMTLTNHLVSPVIIPDLMEYAMSLDVERDPFLTSAVLVNFASMAHRVCISESHQNYSVSNPIFGKEKCQAEPIVTEFLTHLVTKLQNAKEEWQKAIYVEAIANLGTPLALPSLRKFITEEPLFSLKIRLLSISALSRNKMPFAIREEVFDMLMDVVDNLGNSPEIRQASIKVLLSWHPDSAWWKRLAKLTWREPSQSLNAFFTSTVEGLARSTDPLLRDQSQIADFVLPLMKPISVSFKHSYNYIYSRYDPVSKMTLNGNFATFKNSKNLLPSQMFAKLQSSFGGLNLDIFEFMAISNGLEKQLSDLMKQLQSSDAEQQELLSRFPSLPAEIFPRIMNEEKDDELLMKDPESLISVKIFENIHAFVPLNLETLKKLGEPSKEPIKEFLEGIMNERNLTILKYLNPLDIQYFVPTEIGLPLVGSVSLPVLLKAEGKVKLMIDDLSADKISVADIMKYEKYQLSVKSNYRLISKLVSNLKVLCPWEESSIEAGVESFKEINLPFHANVTFINLGRGKKLDFEFGPTTQKEFPLVYAHNLPYTVLRPFYKSNKTMDDLSILLVDKQRQPLIKESEIVPSKAVGQNITLEYRADEPYPFTKYHLTDYLQKPELALQLLSSPTSRYWQMSFNHHPNELFLSKPAVISFVFGQVVGKDSDQTTNEDEHLNKTSIHQHGSCKNISMCPHLHKFNGYQTIRGKYAIKAELRPYGSKLVVYSASIASVKTSEYGQKLTDIPINKYTTTLSLGAATGQEELPVTYSLDVETSTPKIKNLEDLKEFNLGLVTSAKGRVYREIDGVHSDPIASFEVNMLISPERQREIEYELDALCDGVESVANVQTEVIYDELKLDIKFAWENISKSLQNLTLTAEKLMEGACWPHVEYNKLYVQNQPNAVSVEGKRSLSSTFYTFWIRKPEKNVILSEVAIADSLTTVVPWTGLREAANMLEIVPPLAGNMCEILPIEGILTTHDGLRYPYHADHCWTVTSVNPEAGIIIHTRQVRPNLNEARIQYFHRDTIVTLSHEKLNVNGQVMALSYNDLAVKDLTGKVLIQVKLVINGTQARILDKMLIVAMTGIYLTPDSSVKTQLAGPCGNFDEDPFNDMIGPQNCRFTDSELYKYAWTVASGDQCNKKHLADEKFLVEKFRNSTLCVKDNNATSLNGTEMNSLFAKSSESFCNMMVYHVQQSRDALCVTENRYIWCKPDCIIIKSADDVVKGQGKCWPDKDVPSEVREALSAGYLRNPVKEEGKYKKELKIKRHNRCLLP